MEYLQELFKQDKLQIINLHNLSESLCDYTLDTKNAELFRQFMAEKISNGTLYTPADLYNYPLSKRLQLFINSNIAEHAIQDCLGGDLLSSNDLLTVNSVAVIGNDGCALADLTIDNIDIEVKVTYNTSTRADIFAKAHKKQVVAVYTISTDESSHWSFYVRNINGSYQPIDVIVGLNLSTVSSNLANQIKTWQDKLRISVPKLPLLYLKDEVDGGLSVTLMFQR